MNKRTILFALFISTIAYFISPALADRKSPEQWYESGHQALQLVKQNKAITQRARNIILFIGDGMGVSTVTAARILDGQLRGAEGEENSLSFESLPYLALSKTYNTNQQTPDSAGTMTAMMTGVKTKAGLIAVNDRARRADCSSQAGNELTTLLEELEDSGYATGIVTTTRVTHATPAATYAHTTERNWESDGYMTADAIRGGCKDIARQLVEFAHGNGIELVMGGGRRNFIGSDKTDVEYPKLHGKRADGRDLIKQWQMRYSNGSYIWNKSQLAKLNINRSSHVLALFEPSHMKFESDRHRDKAGEPSIAEMTEFALNFLQKSKPGFFLMVEGGRIDHAHHYGNAYRALHDTRAFAKAISVAMNMINIEETLVIVTADHSHVFTMGGYPTRGNSILGKVVANDAHGESKQVPELAKDGKPYTTLGYYSGDGFAVLDDITRRNEGIDYGQSGRADITDINTSKSNYYQESLIPLIDETHGGEDVAIYAGGPGAHLVRGVQEQNYIYHVMKHAIQAND